MAPWTCTTRGTREFLFLGTGTSVGVPVIGCQCRVCTSDNPRWNRTRSSVLIRSPEGNLLIDTSPDLRQQMLREKIDRVHAVLYTHQHADHVFGLDDCRVFCHYLGGSLPVFCDPPVEDFLRQAFSYAFDPIVRKYPAGGIPNLEFHRIERPSFRVLDHVVTPIPLRHGRFDVLGFRIDNVAYCTDVNVIPETSFPLLEGLDLLIVDALRMSPHPTHFSVPEALAAIERIAPKQALFTHISCQLDPEQVVKILPPHVGLAHDGMQFSF